MDDSNENVVVKNETAPLLMEQLKTPPEENSKRQRRKRKRQRHQHHPFFYQSRRQLGISVLLLIGIAMALMFLSYNQRRQHQQIQSTTIIPIEEAQEHTLQVDIVDDESIFVWFRTWGNAAEGVPLLFVHGGPGGAVADYHNGNQRFFDATKLYVVEVDQRGTGRSQPSVRDDLHNARLYSNISIAVINRDYEHVREYLGIEQWVVWGGSYGSTIGLDYAMRYPERTLSLILR